MAREFRYKRVSTLDSDHAIYSVRYSSTKLDPLCCRYGWVEIGLVTKLRKGAWRIDQVDGRSADKALHPRDVNRFPTRDLAAKRVLSCFAFLQTDLAKSQLRGNKTRDGAVTRDDAAQEKLEKFLDDQNIQPETAVKVLSKICKGYEQEKNMPQGARLYWRCFSQRLEEAVR